MTPGSMHPTSQPPVLQDIRSQIDTARHRVAARVNAEITTLHGPMRRHP